MYGAFQSNAFQSNAFQVALTPTPSTQPVGGGGYVYSAPRRRKTDEEVRQERVALGIIPAPVERVVAKVAERIVNKAAPGADPLELLREEQARYEAQLQQRLKAQKLEFDSRYMLLVALEIQRVMYEQEQAEEDEQIVHLLMEM